jgi:hypothetical protein
MFNIHTTSIEITNSAGEKIGNQFFRLPNEASALGLVFPGQNYTCEMPLLYYATNLLLERGCNVLQVRVDYTRAEFQALSRWEQAQKLGTDASTALQALLHAARQPSADNQGDLPIYVLGKSIGTIATALLLAGFSNLPFKPIWLTPLLRQPLLMEAALDWKSPALWIASQEDHTFDESSWTRLAKISEHQCLLLEHGNHRLEVPGNLELTLSNLQATLQAIELFLKS